MALVDSLLTAMVRANGDALVMHVGEKPYVVTDAGPIDLSTHGLNLQAMTGMLSQLLPAEAQHTLREFGAVEQKLPPLGHDHFTVVAARGGDDIWIEIRRRRPKEAKPVEAPVPARAAQTAVAAAAGSAPAVAVLPATEPISARVPAVAAVTPAPAARPAPMPDPVPSPMPAVARIAAVGPEAPAAERAPASDPFPSPLPAMANVSAVVPEAASARPASATAVATPAPVAPPIVEPAPAAAVSGVSAVAPVLPPAITSAPTPAVPALPAATIVPAVAAPAAVSEPVVTIVDVPAEDPPTEKVAPLPVAASLSANAAPAPAVAAPEPATPQPVAAAATVAAAEPAAVEPADAAPPPAVEDRPVAPQAIAPAAPAEAPLPETPPAAVEPLSPSSSTGDAPPPQAPPGRDEPPVPMTRTVRIEVPTRAVSSRPSTVERLLRLAAARGASALFMPSQSRPYVRVEGDMRPLEGEPVLGASEIEAAVLDVVPEATRDNVRRGEWTEWLAEIAELGRVRCTSFRDHRGPGALFRLISTRAVSVEQLDLARELQSLATEADGLVLVAGPRGSGKSTLLSAFVDLINRQRSDYVITLERQLRLLHEPRAALISQREVRGDVFVIEDLEAPGLQPLVLDAAAEGMLVLVSMTVPSTTEAVQQFVNLAPADKRAASLAALAGTFRGAVAQVLLRRTGGGRIAARELLLGTGPVMRLIAEGQLGELPQALENARQQGMLPLGDTLLGLVRDGVVDVREAYRKAADRERLLTALRREGIDTSQVERLA
jgi:twitching motility protein PilT